MHHIDASYNLFLVALSFLVSVFGSYTALQLMRAMRSAAASSQYAWMFAAAFALGGGAIWTMHFIGMIAYHAGIEVAPVRVIALGRDRKVTFPLRAKARRRRY